MNIRWNSSENRFEAEFSSDFQGDLAAVKQAKFRTDGPPGWIWHTQKIAVINYLRRHKPASGLNIYPQALAVYQPLAEIEDKNQQVKKEFQKLQRQLKKTRESQARDAEIAEITHCPEGKMFITKDDLPPMPEWVPQYVIPPPPDLKCKICRDPVYFYEYPEIPMCIWCVMEHDKNLKIVLDKSEEVCETSQ